MERDPLQETWRSQDVQHVTIDVDTLLRLVKRNYREFRSTILGRDVIEVAIALALTVTFVIFGVVQAWPWFVLAAGCLFVGGFMVIDRQIHERGRVSNGETVAAWIENSRADIKHQIVLLKNVFWWYLLPPLVGIAAVFGHSLWEAWQRSPDFRIAVGFDVGRFAICCVVFYGVYLLNQRAVRKDLQPRLEELERLAEGLTRDEA